jgi:hypothetical protein
MPTVSLATNKTPKPFPARHRTARKIRLFSLLMGMLAALLTVCVYLASAYPALRRSKEVNLRTLSEIDCTETGCDTGTLTTDWQLGGSDYVIDAPMRYFLNVPTTTVENPARFMPLDYSDTGFIARFRQPTSYRAPNREVWRLYSREAIVGNRSYEIIVGYAETAPWKMIDTPHSQIGIVDAKLQSEADKIAAAFVTERAALRGTRADGFEVVDANTGQVEEWGPWLPIFLPRNTRLPTPGRAFYVYDGDLYVVQTDTNGRLLAVSLVSVGGLWWLAVLAGFTFLCTTVIASLLSRRFLRSYFALKGMQLPNLEDAQRRGEGQNIEFKRGLSEDETRGSHAEDELLKSIVSFANTNDGVIFVGIDDDGHIKGLELDFKQKDRFEQKIRQLVRNRVKPMPPVEVAFLDVRGFVIAKISVARGDAPAYMIGGAIYVRSGSSDVQAQPEDLKRLVTEYAF